jgi:hypothetical protein
MNSHAYRFPFSEKTDLQEVEASLLLAVLAAECLHGRARVRLDVSFCLDQKKRSCIIAADTGLGRTISRIFTGFLCLEFGEKAFNVKLISNDGAPMFVRDSEAA